MPYKKAEIKKIHYSISETARILEVSVSNVRYWLKEFNHIKPFRFSNGSPSLTEDDINELKLIKYLVKDRKYRIAGAKEKLKHNRADVVNNQKIVEHLTKVRTMLANIKQELEK